MAARRHSLRVRQDAARADVQSTKAIGRVEPAVYLRTDEYAKSVTVPMSAIQTSKRSVCIALSLISGECGA